MNLQEDTEDGKDTITSFLDKDQIKLQLNPKEPIRRQTEGGIKSNVLAPIKLKGVDLPNFSGDDRGDYPSWKSAFVSLIAKYSCL